MVHPDLGRLNLNYQGYPRFSGGPHKDKLVHRVIWERIAGRNLPKGYQVHHMGPKTCWCPHNLVELPPALHPTPEPLRDPYTGMFLSIEAYERRFGCPPPEVLAYER